ncbi:uncharacterized protein LAJ45_06603 [Morchella importuna]|uniref:uncharacterized protein n=1 Tax=Morchella importuna TaxID=1174673 RepID=UPI001E8EC25E|nr:uncharacterized protein LAJ45_06603 [Morchella importuna]KAH8149523.1 hypothetical protein LAJ45_06603 [Morchella importuna]
MDYENGLISLNTLDSFLSNSASLASWRGTREPSVVKNADRKIISETSSNSFGDERWRGMVDVGCCSRVTNPKLGEQIFCRFGGTLGNRTESLEGGGLSGRIFYGRSLASVGFDPNRESIFRDTKTPTCMECEKRHPTIRK